MHAFMQPGVLSGPTTASPGFGVPSYHFQAYDYMPERHLLSWCEAQLVRCTRPARRTGVPKYVSACEAADNTCVGEREALDLQSRMARLHDVSPHPEHACSAHAQRMRTPGVQRHADTNCTAAHALTLHRKVACVFDIRSHSMTVPVQWLLRTCTAIEEEDTRSARVKVC
eukprot:202061-Chlamydomonas_euryale.AAC.5